MKFKEITLDVIGMGCQNCVETITNALNNTDGVQKVNVSLDDEEAEIEYNAKKLDVDELINVIQASGYDAKRH